MPQTHRREIIREIETLRGSRVIAYVTGDRNPAPSQIGDDVVRPLYDHLRGIGKTGKLDLVIYSRGGAIDVPWRINTALRATADHWAALIPFRAQSAATLLCLGADEIVLGRHGELGPIDPIMTIRQVIPGGGTAVVQSQVPVEDIMAYVKFVQERAGLSDQDALAVSLGKLADRLDAVTLGSAYRTHSHIRDVARRMLLSRRQPGPEQTVSTIVETLAERVYAHGHAIGLRNAQEIGLPAVAAQDKLDTALWNLLLEYEQDLKLKEPLDPITALANNEHFNEDWTIAIIDSASMTHEFTGKLEISSRRQLPPQLNASVNVNVVIPEGLQQQITQSPGNPNQLQQVLQQIAQLVQKVAVQSSQQAVQDALKQQAPRTGIDVALRDGRWRLAAN